MLFRGLMGRLGVISGTLALQGKDAFGKLRKECLETGFGAAQVLYSPNIALIPRHGCDPNYHILPHRINHQANLMALKMLDVDEVIGINSTGSLKNELNPGAIVIPNDFIMIFGGPTAIEAKPVHIAPEINDGVRQKAIDAARSAGIDIVDSGIYWQTQGPRLETRSEIRLMSRFADVVGMTMASEAVIAQELGVPYASVCSVDNFAHGIGRQKLTMESILEHARRNTDAILKILLQYLDSRTT